MRCEGLTALQAADFSIGGNGGKVKQQCAPGAMSSGAGKGLGAVPVPEGEVCPGCPHELCGNHYNSLGTSWGADRMSVRGIPSSGAFGGTGHVHERA